MHRSTLAALVLSIVLLPHCDNLKTLLGEREADPPQPTTAAKTLQALGLQRPVSEDLAKASSGLAIDNDYAMIGSGRFDNGNGVSYNSGTVTTYAFESNAWVEKQTLRSDLQADGDFFGEQIGIVDDIAVISAQNENVGAFTDAGYVYVFENQSGTWNQIQKIPNPGASGGDTSFGLSLTFDGNHLAVFALHDYGGQSDSIVYLYEKQGATLAHIDTISSPTPTPNGNFGRAMDLDGNLLMIGAPGYLSPTLNTFAGKVFIFDIENVPAVEVASHQSPVDVTQAWFGAFVAIDGDDALIGSLGIGAFKIKRSNSTWAAPIAMQANSQFISTNIFGAAVALEGDVAIVGAPGGIYFGGMNGVDGGQAVLYLRNDEGQYDAKEPLTPSSGLDTDDGFGAPLVMRNGRILIGSPNDDGAGNGGNDLGAAYFFDYR